jgi:large subunit ribosomal protein L11
MAGTVIPVEITIFDDRSFTFVTKTPPATDLLKKALALEKGFGNAGHNTAPVLSRAKLKEIAALKMKDLNAIDLPGAERIIEGSARSMGIKVE